MIEFLIEFLFEFLFQAVFEILVGVIDGSLRLSERVAKALFKFVLYFMLGAMLGLVSYSVVPHTLSGNPASALLSLVVLPLSVGLFSVLTSRIMERKWDWDVGFSRFSYSLVFAWAFAGGRFIMLH